MIRTLLIVITITGCLAQLEPDIGIDSPPESVPDKDIGSLSSLLKDQLTRQRASSRSNSLPPVAAAAAATTTTATVIPTTDLTSQTLSSTIVPSSTVQITSLDQRPPQFQYVKALSARQCYHNNRTYSIGQKWNDDCLQVCKCVAADESGSIAVSACENRCPTYNDPPGVGCTLVRSKIDECCLEYVCSTEGKFPPPTTMTVINTELGQLNVSTTEIKLPSSTSTLSQQPSTPITSASTTTTITTVQPPTTTFQPIRSSISPQQLAQAQQLQQQKQQTKISMTTTQQQQVPTTTTPTITTTSKQPNSSQQQTNRRQPVTTTTSSTPVNSRAPKQVSGEPTVSSSQILATQSPNSLPPQKSHSLVTTTNFPQTREFGQRMLNPSTAFQSSDAESRQNVIVSTPTTTTTTEAPEEADPGERDLCIIDEDSAAYPINLSWSDDCNQTCRCVFRKEPRDPTVDVRILQTINLRSNKQTGYIEETEIRCSLSPQCSFIDLKLARTNDCPNPKLIFPQPLKFESPPNCNCPNITCLPPQSLAKRPINQQQTTLASDSRSSIGPTSATTAASMPTTTTAVLEGCRQGNRILNYGESFNDECHSTCSCHLTGEVKCHPIICPNEPPKDISCESWILDPTFKQNSSDNQCCPQFICQNRDNNDEMARKLGSCTLLGKEFLNGDIIPEEMQPRSQECDKICTCKDTEIRCTSICLPISDTPPLDLTCPPEQAIQAMVDCCTQWICPPEDYELKELNVKPINSTTANISFVMPVSSIERAGRIELNYIGVPMNSEQALGDKPPASSVNWIRKTNIKTEKGIFLNHKIKYNMNNLKPNHKYWFKVIVEFDGPVEPPFDSPLVSQIQQVVMPPPPDKTPNTPSRVIFNENPTTTTAKSTPPPPSSTTTILSTTTTTTTPPTTTASSTTSTTTPPPTMRLQPVHQSTPSIAYKPTTTTSTTTTTTTTTTEPPTTTKLDWLSPKLGPPDNGIVKQDVGSFGGTGKATNNNGISPCGIDNGIENDHSPLPWTPLPTHMNAPIQKYAWHILVALSIMTILFTIVSYLYLKKSSRVIAPITSQSAYDNPSFTKLVSYYANQPHVLLVDESNQNYNNDAILAKQKNIEVDKSSPLHHHNNQIGDIHHHNGRQRLI